MKLPSAFRRHQVLRAGVLFHDEIGLGDMAREGRIGGVRQRPGAEHHAREQYQAYRGYSRACS